MVSDDSFAMGRYSPLLDAMLTYPLRQRPGRQGSGNGDIGGALQGRPPDILAVPFITAITALVA